MPLVEVETWIRGPAEKAYALIKDMESYPRFMDAVKELRVLERDGDTLLTEWTALFQGRLLRWRERDVFDDATLSMTYRQTEGDLKRFQGEWRCLSEGDGVRVTLSVDFDLGVPMLSGLLDPVAKLVTRRNCESMLAAIRTRVESRPEVRAEGTDAPWN
jgi:coenzyme Q-binding protein COQ10